MLVAPVWPSQAWHLTLLSLLVDLLILLPTHVDLLRDSFNRPHPLLVQRTLQLAAWKVSGRDSWQRDFQRRLQTSWQQDGVEEPSRLTSQPGRGGWAGVIDGVWIPFRVASECL